MSLAALVRVAEPREDRKSTRLNSSHRNISYAVFCLKKKTREAVGRRAHERRHVCRVTGGGSRGRASAGRLQQFGGRPHPSAQALRIQPVFLSARGPPEFYTLPLPDALRP